ncbi:MAG: hypothetical protein DLM69_07710 [Candidatus Chloroheliales bacterium]|nr:MAG: hypothetical protein DLM69_07710 [Chloroflexota bacterium]
MSEATRKATPPGRRLTHAVAYTLAIALPLLALCYIAGELLYTLPACSPRPDLGITEPVDSFRQHGFPFVMMIDHKAGCYEQAVHTYDWNLLALIADVVLWVSVAWLCYWLLSGLRQTIHSLRR